MIKLRTQVTVCEAAILAPAWSPASCSSVTAAPAALRKSVPVCLSWPRTPEVLLHQLSEH